MSGADRTDPTRDHSDASQGWQLAPGSEIVLLDDGLLVRGLKSARIDFGSRCFERDFVRALRSADPSSLYASYSSDQIARCLSALTELGVVIAGRSARVVNLLVDASDVAPACAPETTIVVASIRDPRAGEWLDALRRASAPCLFMWTSGKEIAIARHSAVSRPCALCALLFDTSAADAAVPEALVAAVYRAPRSCLRVGDPTVERVALAWAKRLALPGSTWPAVGQALIFDVIDWTLQRESYPAHPGCACSAETHSSVTARSEVRKETQWEDFSDRRFAPLACVDSSRSAGVARAVFRRSRRPWPLATGAFGAATAIGIGARTRALAEGIERFAMLHRASDLAAAPGEDLREVALDDGAIQQLLFRDEERHAPGFRFGDFSSKQPLAWSWASDAQTGERRLIPTSLVGRAPEGSPALVDATSNGYAAHTVASSAVEHALSEIIERDAILSAWYTGAELARIDVTNSPEANELPAELAVFLATNDIDLPVLWLVAPLGNGSFRCASAAAACLRGAWLSALSELRAALAVADSEGGRRSSRAPANLSDAAQAFGPRAHFDYYAVPECCEPLRRRLAQKPVLSMEALERRWPERDGDQRSSLLDALERVELRAWVVDRSLPELFPGWHVVRVLVPGTVELSWGQAYRRLAGPRFARRLAQADELCPWPHPVA